MDLADIRASRQSLDNETLFPVTSCVQLLLASLSTSKNSSSIPRWVLSLLPGPLAQRMTCPRRCLSRELELTPQLGFYDLDFVPILGTHHGCDRKA